MDIYLLDSGVEPGSQISGGKGGGGGKAPLILVPPCEMLKPGQSPPAIFLITHTDKKFASENFVCVTL